MFFWYNENLEMKSDLSHLTIYSQKKHYPFKYWHYWLTLIAIIILELVGHILMLLHMRMPIYKYGAKKKTISVSIHKWIFNKSLVGSNREKSKKKKKNSFQSSGAQSAYLIIRFICFLIKLFWCSQCSMRNIFRLHKYN